MNKHLEIKQNATSESVNSTTIEKLYNLTYEDNNLGIQPIVDSVRGDIVGNITPTAAYEDAILFLKTKFGPDIANNIEGLTINISTDDCYIRFADNNVLGILLNSGIGDSVGITKSLARNTTSFTSNIFKNNTSIQSFNELEKFGLTTIASSMFLGCTSLLSIDLSKILTINQNAFKDCTALSLELNCPSLTTIGIGAFWNSGITKIVNLGSVVTITGSLGGASYPPFSNCTNLTEVTLPSGVTVIGREAFSKCKNLTTLNDFDFSLVTSLDQGCFSGCTSLQLNIVNAPNINGSFTDRPFADVRINHIYLPNITDGPLNAYCNGFNYHRGMFASSSSSNGAVINILYLKNINKVRPGDFCYCNIRKLVINNTLPPLWCNTKDASDENTTSGGENSKDRVFWGTKIDGTSGNNVISAIYVPDSAMTDYTTHPYWSLANNIIHPISDLVQKTKAEWDLLSNENKASTLISDYM